MPGYENNLGLELVDDRRSSIGVPDNLTIFETNDMVVLRIPWGYLTGIVR